MPHGWSDEGAVLAEPPRRGATASCAPTIRCAASMRGAPAADHVGEQPHGGGGEDGGEGVPASVKASRQPRPIIAAQLECLERVGTKARQGRDVWAPRMAV